jgi:hypothetical protein
MCSTSFARTVLTLLLPSLLLVACGGTSDSDAGPPVITDTTPPYTSADPIGGLYPAPQVVSLTANESATVYYTTDGFPPTVGGTTTYSGQSPVSGILVDHDLALRFFSVDDAGNQEQVKIWNYTFDFDPPSILISDFLTGTYGLFEEIEVKFSSDEIGSWGVEIGGTGIPGSGTVVGTGYQVAFEPLSVPLPAWRLEIDNQNPGTSVWAWVKDSAGGLASYEFEIKTRETASVPVPGESLGLELLNDGSFGCVLRPETAEVWKFDSDSQSATFNQVVSTIGVGANPTGMALSPDDARLYVTDDGGFSEIDLATELVTTIALPGGQVPSGAAIQPDALVALVGANDGTFWQLDVDPLSAGYGTWIQLSFSEPFMTSAEINLSPTGDRAIITWSGNGMYGVDVLDTDPLSPGYLTAPDELFEVLEPPVISSAVIDADSGNAWIGDIQGRLQRVLLDEDPPQLGGFSSALTVRGMTMMPGEQFLLLTGGPLDGIRFVIPVTLQLAHFAPSQGVSGSGTGRQIRFTPDGERAYLVRDNGSATGEVWMLWLTSL